MQVVIGGIHIKEVIIRDTKQHTACVAKSLEGVLEVSPKKEYEIRLESVRALQSDER